MKIDLVVCGYIFWGNKVLLIHHNKTGLWLGIGGHIEENETPDAALKREAKEEVGIKIEILNQGKLPVEGNVKENLATPFYVNLHSVGGHYHSCFYYVCRAINPEQIKIKRDEISGFGWFSKEELKDVPPDVKTQILEAYKIVSNEKTT